GGVVVIEEVVFADGAHVGADALANLAVELLQRDAFPLGGSLHYLGIDGVLATIIRDVELDGSARTVAIQHVVDAALDIDNQRDFHHEQIKFLAEIVFDVALHVENGLLGFLRGEERMIIGGENAFEFGVIADAGTGQIGFLVEYQSAHEVLSLADGVLRRRKSANTSLESGMGDRSVRWVTAASEA